MKTFIGGIGCFWDETKYENVPGVISTECGYCGGDEPNITYKAVCGGDTKHIEVVKVEFDTNVIDFNKLLDIFWDIHDPTQINRQGVDIGTQYRSCIFTDYEPYIEIAKNAIDALNTSKRYNNPISTILYENVTFFEAENYHQKYLFR